MTEDKSTVVVEDLLKPRYKVIADYPRQLFQIGDILEGNVAYVAGEKDEWSYKAHLADYPSIFKPLFWWEERKIEDMPQFVKIPHYPNGETDFEIVNIDGDFIKHDFTTIGYFGLKYKNGGGLIHSCFTPATIEQYNQYINQKA